MRSEHKNSVESPVTKPQAHNARDGASFDLSHVAIVTPCRSYGNIHVHTAMWLIEQARRGARWLPIASYSCSFGRNGGTQTVLSTMPDVTHVAFLDSDTAPPPDALDRLLAHNKHIVTGITPQIQGKMAQNDNVCVIRASVSDGPRKNGIDLMYYHELPENLFEVEWFGGPFFVVKREVFEALDWPYFRMIYARTTMVVPEDFYFCLIAKESGYKIWADPHVHCRHYHTLDVWGSAVAGINTWALNAEEAIEDADDHEQFLSDDEVENIKKLCQEGNTL